jgi:recombinational DNA repair protein (RecF pathway)
MSFYINDILIHFKTSEKHLYHLDTVTGKLTEAGFTLNTAKCYFCRQEVKFLGHCIDKTGVSVDPDHAVAILNNPAPTNIKQLCQILGTCNFHSHFIIVYANYVAELLSLLKQEAQ